MGIWQTLVLLGVQVSKKIQKLPDPTTHRVPVAGIAPPASWNHIESQPENESSDESDSSSAIGVFHETLNILCLCNISIYSGCSQIPNTLDEFCLFWFFDDVWPFNDAGLMIIHDASHITRSLDLRFFSLWWRKNTRPKWGLAESIS